MLKFLVFHNGKPAKEWPIRNAHLLGSDGSAVRADIWFTDGTVCCQKRETGAAALALQQPVGDCGELTIQTCLLPEREEPYLLMLELARHRLMVLFNKMEDWGMLDIGEDHPVSRRADLSKRLFVEALCQQGQDPSRADRLARDCLITAIDGTEELALAHAELLLNRRKSTGALPKYPLGTGVSLELGSDRIRAAVQANFDHVLLPVPWKLLAPEEGEYRWQVMDQWVEWASRSRLPVIAGPVISFESTVLPDWLYIWEHDYDTVRDLLYEHLERVVTRYRNAVSTWIVVSGLHVNSHFSFAFDQLMDLTRMAVMLTKKIQPAARAIVEVRQPFGEYYAANPRSIPPTMYADLLVQGAIPFDGLAVKLLMGQASPGQYTRDLMQISNLLDQFAAWGKPLHLTVAAPSNPVTELMLFSPDPEAKIDANCGYWRKPWSPVVQSHWLEAVLYIAMSKPTIDSISWHELVDHPDMELPLEGLVSEDLQPKTAFRRLVTFRKNLLTGPAPMQSIVNPQIKAAAAAAPNAVPPSAVDVESDDM